MTDSLKWRHEVATWPSLLAIRMLVEVLGAIEFSMGGYGASIDESIT